MIYKSMFFTSIVISCLLFATLCQADIYLYIDKNGNEHFSENKVNKDYQLLLRSQRNTAPATFKNWKEKSYRNVRVPVNKKLQYQYHSIIVRAAEHNSIEPEFIHAVITAESAYRQNAVSNAGAQGLMQLMPQTAKRFGVDDAFDPHQNIVAGSFYLKTLLAEFETKELALAAYNAGEGTVRRYNNTIPPYFETQQYVEKVMNFYWYYKENMTRIHNTK
ncbi:MAG: lytic transglycosylase domain-containing protein [Psychromonas sp.]|nr:lytic transglycosylase domain-containing protein [Psychromonas sp.]